MTKELLDLLDKLNIQNYSLYSAIYDELTENHVCIPKGENRHSYADVLHEWIEDTTKILEYADSEYRCKWLRTSIPDIEYRIKPSEPIYEWQWYWVEDGIATIANSGKFMTDDEANIDTPIWYKFEQTKKERK